MHEEAKQIPLRRPRQGVVAYALVDAADFERFGSLRWHLGKDGYVARSLGTGRGTFYLHRAILGLGTYKEFPKQVDHISGDKLDNQRCNLRIVTNAQNAQNRGSRPGSRSTYRGVSWCARQQRWDAKVTKDGIVVFRARFDTELEAAHAAEAARLEHLPFAMPDPRLSSPFPVLLFSGGHQ